MPSLSDPGQNRYIIARGLSRRSRMLWAGVPPLVSTKAKNPCRIAVEEWRADLLAFERVMPAKPFLVARPEALEEREGDRAAA